MKKIPILIAFMCLVLAARAQMAIGFKTGMTVSTLSIVSDGIDPMPGLKKMPGLGYFISGQFETGISERITFAAALQHTQISSSVEVSEEYLGGYYYYKEKSKVNMQYLQVPVFVKYSLSTTRLKPYVLFGITPAYLGAFSTKTSYEEFDGTMVYEGTDSYSVSGSDWETFSRIEISGTTGFGIYHETGPGKFNLELRYNHSFTDISRSSGHVMNRTLLLGVGYLLSL